MSLVHDTIKSVVDFVLPHECLLCNKELNKDLICENCIDYLPIVRSPFCSVCGRPIHKGDVCSHCNNDVFLDHGRAWMLFVPPVDSMIHHFKYRKKTKLAEFMGRAMATIIRSDFHLQQADSIVPVPLFWWNYLKRGYNQAALLSAVISRECGIPLVESLRRVRKTKTQTRLRDAVRRKNVLDAFAVAGDVDDKTIILVDDVMTTGATLNECARILKQAGAQSVYSCVAAITPG